MDRKEELINEYKIVLDQYIDGLDKKKSHYEIQKYKDKLDSIKEELKNVAREKQRVLKK